MAAGSMKKSMHVIQQCDPMKRRRALLASTPPRDSRCLDAWLGGGSKGPSPTIDDADRPMPLKRNNSGRSPAPHKHNRTECNERSLTSAIVAASSLSYLKKRIP